MVVVVARFVGGTGKAVELWWLAHLKPLIAIGEFRQHRPDFSSRSICAEDGISCCGTCTSGSDEYSRKLSDINARRIIQIGLILGVTVGCMAYALWGMDWDLISASFRQANYWSLPPMMLVLFVFYALKAWRWKLLLRPVKELTTMQVTPALMTGFMANNLLPAHLGEFVRVFALGRQYNLEKTPVLSTVVLERVFDILAILLLLGISLPFIEGLPPRLETGCRVFGAASLVGVIVLLIYMTCTAWFVKLTRTVFSWFPFLPTKLTEGIVGMLETGAVGLESVRNPALLAGIAVSSVGQWLLNALMIFASLWAFGVDASYFDAVLVMGVIVFAILLPSTPGYFGVIQACFAAVLADKFAKPDVFGASIYYHMCQWVPVTLIGLVFANGMGLSLGDMQSAAKVEPVGEDGNPYRAPGSEVPVDQ